MSSKSKSKQANLFQMWYDSLGKRGFNMALTNAIVMKEQESGLLELIRLGYGLTGTYKKDKDLLYRIRILEDSIVNESIKDSVVLDYFRDFKQANPYYKKFSLIYDNMPFLFEHASEPQTSIFRGQLILRKEDRIIPYGDDILLKSFWDLPPLTWEGLESSLLIKDGVMYLNLNFSEESCLDMGHLENIKDIYIIQEVSKYVWGDALCIKTQRADKVVIDFEHDRDYPDYSYSPMPDFMFKAFFETKEKPLLEVFYNNSYFGCMFKDAEENIVEEEEV
jgi:hypothetical protein